MVLKWQPFLYAYRTESKLINFQLLCSAIRIKAINTEFLYLIAAIIITDNSLNT
jgi:hypothetical protein